MVNRRVPVVTEPTISFPASRELSPRICQGVSLRTFHNTNAQRLTSTFIQSANGRGRIQMNSSVD